MKKKINAVRQSRHFRGHTQHTVCFSFLEIRLNNSTLCTRAKKIAQRSIHGRLLGKALFDGQLVQAHLVRPLYKHLLGWPIAFSDLEHVDHFTYESLIKMTELDDVEVCVCVCVV